MHGFGRFDNTARLHSPQYVVLCPFVFRLDIRCNGDGRVSLQTDEKRVRVTDHSKAPLLIIHFSSAASQLDNIMGKRDAPRQR